MAEQRDSQAATAVDLSVAQRNHGRPDPLLQDLVRMANTADIGDFVISVTLLISGTLISGTLIGVQEYYAEHGKWWRSLLADAAEGEKTELEWIAEGEIALRETRQTNQEEFTFIHLKDAQVVSGAAVIPAEGGSIWRARLADVNAYTLTRFTLIRQERPIKVEVSTPMERAR